MTRVYKPKELSSETGVQEHVASIREYWWAKGYRGVDAWPVRLNNDASKRPYFTVQSNLVNGRPT